MTVGRCRALPFFTALGRGRTFTSYALLARSDDIARLASLNVALVSIGTCPSLALRNLRRYALAHDDIVRAGVSFTLFDLDLAEFKKTHESSAQKWSFVTKFDDTLAELVKLSPRVVAFSCYLWNVEVSIRLATLVKRMLPGALVVLGGPDPGPRAVELLRVHREIDVIVEGDGEVPFLGILRHLLAPAEIPLTSVPQLHMRESDRCINTGPGVLPDMTLLCDVHQPVPSQDELSRWAWPYLLYETQRGCPYACSYCMYGKTKVATRDPTLVAEELAALLATGVSVELIDPTFSTYVSRAKSILRLLSERDYPGHLYFEAYPDSIDEEMADLFVRARVSRIGLGFQTLSTEGLRAVRRPKNLTKFERAIRLLEEREISFYVDVIYGLPNTTNADFYATMDYLYEVGVEGIQIYRLLGLPGSPMLADVGKYALVFNPSPPYELVRSATYSIDDLIECERFTQAFYACRGSNRALLDTLAQLNGSFSRLISNLGRYGLTSETTSAQANEIFARLMVERAETAPTPSVRPPGENRTLPVISE